mmetsp:Transcript_15146/g.37351  ORF Transcript_15146/g.37351 Transcript_15146/m.37351 type:complete len:166 (-) Transcript_15146:465-962(-)
MQLQLSLRSLSRQLFSNSSSWTTKVSRLSQSQCEDRESSSARHDMPLLVSHGRRTSCVGRTRSCDNMIGSSIHGRAIPSRINVGLIWKSLLFKDLFLSFYGWVPGITDNRQDVVVQMKNPARVSFLSTKYVLAEKNKPFHFGNHRMESVAQSDCCWRMSRTPKHR